MMKFLPVFLLISIVLIGCAAKVDPILIERTMSESLAALKDAESANAERYAYSEYMKAKEFYDLANQATDPSEKLDKSQQAVLYSRIAESKARQMAARERLDEIKSEKVRLLIDRMAMQLDEAQIRQQIAEYRASQAEQRAQTLAKTAEDAVARAELAESEKEKQIARSKAEVAISKAEFAKQSADDVNAQSFAGEKYAQADLTLQRAKTAFNSDKFDEAVRVANEAAGLFADSRTSAMAAAEVQSREIEASQQQDFLAASVSIEKADLLLQMSQTFNAQEFAPDQFKEARDLLDRARQDLIQKSYEDAANHAREAEKSALAVQKLSQIRWREAQIAASDAEKEALAKDAIFRAEEALNSASHMKESPLYVLATEALAESKKAFLDKKYQEAAMLGDKVVSLIEDGGKLEAGIEAIESRIIEELKKQPLFKVSSSRRGVLIRISGDLFTMGSSTINPKYTPALKALAELLKKHSKYGVLVEGHTDSVGEASDNLKLSIDRAASFYSFLVANGVDKERIIPAGYGESRPIANNMTEKGRKENRRIDVTILTRYGL